MNAWVRIGTLLLILVGVILCQPLLANYTDPHQRFSLDPPTDWQMQPSADGSGITLFVAPDGKTSLMVFPAEVPENATLDELPSAYEQVLKKTQPKISLKLLKETRVEIARESALQREYHAETGDGNPIKMMATFIKMGPMSLTLVAIANETEFSKFETTFRQCIESLRFSAAKGAEVLSDVQSKLKALEAAHESGILTDEEYARKKAELEAQLRAAVPPLDEATKQKLQALEAAHQAGILSDEEYARKKAELMGQQAVGHAAPVESGANLTLSTPTPIGFRYSDPQGRFQFHHPRDWNAQALPEGQGIALTHGKATVSILVFPGADDAHKLIEAVAGQIREQWQNYRELLRSEWKIGGQPTPFVEFTGMNPQGMPAHSQITVFVASGMGYIFLLTAPENEFAAMQPVRETLLNSFQVGGASLTRREGKTYRHAIGFSFWYPTGWTVKEDEEVIQLVPPNPGSTTEGPNELYFVSAENAAEEGIQRPDDPRIAEYLDMQVQSLSPLLKRVGQVSFIDMAEGRGAVLGWEAGATQGGVVSARAFVSIIKDYVVVLMGIGLKDRLEARNSDLCQIFASFGSGAAPSLPTVAASNEQGQVNIATSSTISANEVGDANWGFKFQPPQGWKSQKSDRAAVLSHDTIAGAILVIPHTATSFQEVQEQMQKGLAEKEVQLYLTGGLQTIGNNTIVGDYAGIFNGQQVTAHGIGTFSPYGGGAYIIAIVVPDKYSPQLSSAADAIAKGMQFFKVDVSDLVTHFSGVWVGFTQNTQTKMVLAPNGEYSDNYESSFSGKFKNQYGDQTGAWGTAGQSQNRGRWTVRGTREQGVIIIKSQDGGETVIEYKVHVEKGQTYWNEYWFNGALYSRQ